MMQLMKVYEIKIERISIADYERLQKAASLHDPPLSVRNYARLMLGIAPRKRGNPTGNKGRKIKRAKLTTAR